MLGRLPRSWILIGAGCAASGAGAQEPVLSRAPESVPFRTRNLSPLVAMFGLPAWHVPDASFEVDFTSELANHYRLSQRGPDQLVLDGETWRNGLFVSKTFDAGWSVSLEWPYYEISGGVLDDVIDGWHSLFGLPDGGRNNRPEGAVLFQMATGANLFYELTSRASGPGDAQLGLAYALGRDDGFHARVTIDLPTGDEDILASNGSTDWAVTLLRSRDVTFRNRPAGFFWGVGMLRLGHADRIEFEQETEGLLGVVGGGLRVTQNIGLKVQLDMHSALFNSQLEEIGERAFQLTIGGSWGFSPRGVLEFGVNEDLEVSTSPDVVLHLNARWRWQ